MKPDLVIENKVRFHLFTYYLINNLEKMKLILNIVPNQNKEDKQNNPNTLPIKIAIGIEGYKFPDLPKEHYDTFKENWLVSYLELSYKNIVSNFSVTFLTAQGLSLLSSFSPETRKPDSKNIKDVTINCTLCSRAEGLRFFIHSQHIISTGNNTDFSVRFYKSPFAKNEYYIWIITTKADLKSILPEELYHISSKHCSIGLKVTIDEEKTNQLRGLLKQLSTAFPVRTSGIKNKLHYCQYLYSKYCIAINNRKVQTNDLCGVCINFPEEQIKDKDIYLF